MERNGERRQAGRRGRGVAGDRVLNGEAALLAETGAKLSELGESEFIGVRGRLSVLHPITGDHGLERPLGEGLDDGPREWSLTHCHESAEDTLSLRLGQKLPSSGTPGNLLGDLLDDARTESVDDFSDAEIHSVLLENSRRGRERPAHKTHGIFFRPFQPKASGHLPLGLHPIGFRVDDGPIHVPQNGVQAA